MSDIITNSGEVPTITDATYVSLTAQLASATDSAEESSLMDRINSYIISVYLPGQDSTPMSTDNTVNPNTVADTTAQTGGSASGPSAASTTSEAALSGGISGVLNASDAITNSPTGVSGANSEMIGTDSVAGETISGETISGETQQGTTATVDAGSAGAAATVATATTDASAAASGTPTADAGQDLNPSDAVTELPGGSSTAGDANALSGVVKLGAHRGLQYTLKPRYFSESALMLAAAAFDMPSMSPTMEMGSIVEWKVKPGQSYKAGDVLLDIETDKAEISVEAVEDGILAKILLENGTKDIPVGKPIAVTAEKGDDLNAINYDQFSAAESKSEPKSESKPEPVQGQPQAQSQPQVQATTESSGKLGQGDFPPLPSVSQLSHLLNIPIDSVHGTGFKGRISKGDMLAKAGKIPAAYLAEEAARISKLSQLDLSNIEVAKPVEPVAGKPAKPEQPKHLVTKESIPLTFETAKLVDTTKKEAIRTILKSRIPKPSVLRDPIFDLLTVDSTLPFEITKYETVISKGKPVSLELEVTEPFKKSVSKEVSSFVEHIKSRL
ncbi:hypothetical protein FF38_08345 [Lucilia cuprina]|uniref:Lipoyl-binding domain-containing protein n=1 Tax=Lucilia cuprina TaxID=7375 RepID=A0A0L0CQ84_LUCCU|nr:hypothetical protein FF38_08345 [Lucilia cuprina]